MAPPAGARHGARRGGTQIRHLRRPRRRACLHAPSCCLSRRVVPVVAPRAKGRHATPCMWPPTLPHARRRRIPPRHLRHVGVAKASGMLLNGRPSSTPPRIDGRPSSSPPHAHTHTVGVHVGNSEARVRKLQGAQHGAQHALSCLIGQHVRMQLGAQRLNRSALPHLSGLIGQPLIDGSSRELRGLSPRR